MRAPRSRPAPGGAPAPWSSEIATVLIPADRIAARVAAMARQISRDFSGRDLVVVPVLTGTVMFLADLLRHLELPLRLDFLGISSYRHQTAPGELILTKDLHLDVRGRDVLVVDDILDTGKTLDRVITRLRALRPRRLRTCVLLDKKARRQIKLTADYTGFEIPDEFVVGYGLDFAERFRNLPFVATLKPEVFRDAARPVSPKRSAREAAPLRP